MAKPGSTRFTLPLGLLATGLLAACAAPPASVAVPASLVPAGERQIDRIPARGALIYECRAATGALRAAWTYVAADLELLDAHGRPVGRHTAQPAVWEVQDGSRIAGEVKVRVDAPQAGAAPWLLVITRSTGGPGRLSDVTSLQRVDTVGGGPPALGCDSSAAGQRQRVPFAAQYVLFGR